LGDSQKDLGKAFDYDSLSRTINKNETRERGNSTILKGELTT